MKVQAGRSQCISESEATGNCVFWMNKILWLWKVQANREPSSESSLERSSQLLRVDGLEECADTGARYTPEEQRGLC